MIFRIIIIILFLIFLCFVIKIYRMLRRIFWLILKKYIIHICLTKIKKEHKKKCEKGKCYDDVDIRENIKALLRENKIEVTEQELDYLIESVYN